MSGFENYGRDTAEIEAEIVRKGIVLGIDWNDPVAVRALAHEALNHLPEELKAAAATTPTDYALMARVDLYGLAGIMLKTMTKSAQEGFASHGGPAWKAFATALWAEAEARGLLA